MAGTFQLILSSNAWNSNSVTPPPNLISRKRNGNCIPAVPPRRGTLDEEAWRLEVIFATNHVAVQVSKIKGGGITSFIMVCVSGKFNILVHCALLLI